MSETIDAMKAVPDARKCSVTRHEKQSMRSDSGSGGVSGGRRVERAPAASYDTYRALQG